MYLCNKHIRGKHLAVPYCMLVHTCCLLFISEFYEWKRCIESQTVATFVKARKDQKFGNSTYCQYYCHRSGRAGVPVTRRRHQKIQGSCKIGAYCPAAIFLRIAACGMYLPSSVLFWQYAFCQLQFLFISDCSWI